MENFEDFWTNNFNYKTLCYWLSKGRTGQMREDECGRIYRTTAQLTGVFIARGVSAVTPRATSVLTDFLFLAPEELSEDY